MSVYLSIIIQNDFNDFGNHEKEVEYAEKSLPLFRKALNNKKYKAIGECTVVDFGSQEPVVIEMPMDDCDILNGELLNGYWAFETYYDDYFLSKRDTDEHSFAVRNLAKFLAELLEQHEAWICVQDHGSESITAPTNFPDWLKYAATIGIEELSDSVLEPLTFENYGFKWKEVVIGDREHTLSYPIYHDNFID